jgi:UDP-2,3-diacylglucosamine pyrophosphatase LpxH
MGSSVHTIVVSDLHLTDAELGQPGKSLWKRYKRPKFFIDQSFKRFVRHMVDETRKNDPEARIELVLNGDIFDFDSVMKLPLHTRIHISWLEKKRGLFPEEEKSRFKMQVILSDHRVWVNTIREFVMEGHSVVFVIGNHDIELHWPMVQKELMHALDLDEESQQRVRICEWFYVSETDTAIEHGNQYDDYCVATNPIHPLIKKGKRIQVRLPFGNITSRYMINGMGLFNPHADTSFLMTLPEYLQFFYKYSLRVHPWLPISWLWSATVSFFIAIGDGILPAMRDPLYIEQRVEEIATKAKASPQMVRTLRELHTHPAIFNPIKIARELWLDRILLLTFLFFVCFQFYMFINLSVSISQFWLWGSFVIVTPLLFFYSRNIKSEVIQSTEEALRQAPLIAQITRTSRVVFGHTHREMHTFVDTTEVLNTGTWSPAFKDPECREPFTKRCFAWIRRESRDAETRVAKLYYWKDPGLEEVPVHK